jgi:hypothetical protein
MQETGGVCVVANADHVPRHGPQGIQEEWTMIEAMLIMGALAVSVVALALGIVALNTANGVQSLTLTSIDELEARIVEMEWFAGLRPPS